jgi:hypothetical protein
MRHAAFRQHRGRITKITTSDAKTERRQQRAQALPNIIDALEN